MTGLGEAKFAHSGAIDIDVPLARAWPVMIDYPSWNPGFTDAVVTTVAGTPGAQGEVVRIEFGDGAGNIVDGLHAETIRLEEGRHLTWFVSPAGDGEGYAEFLDFALVERSPEGVTFILTYYGWDRGTGDTAAYLAEKPALIDTLAPALKQYLEDGS